MASKSLQEKKQQLLRVLDAKRALINEGTSRLQGSLKQPRSYTAHSSVPQKALPQEKQKVILPPIRKVSEQSSSSAQASSLKQGGGKIKSFTQGLVSAATQGRVRKEVLPSLSGKVPVKQVLLGVGVLLAIGMVSAAGKKKKKRKKLLAQAKEQNQVAKYGAGVLLLKWVLSASQPAVKHLLTKQVKKKFLG